MSTITLEMIAKLSNVSRGAVSLVLRDPTHPRFSKGTRERILKVARDLDYVPNRIASGLRRGMSRIIGLVVPWNTPELLDTAELEAKRLGFGMMIQFTQNLDTVAERRALNDALESRVDGLIWLPSDPSSDYKSLVQKIRSTNTHVVLLESPVRSIAEADLVEIDYGDTMRTVLSGFLATGYQKIVYVTRGLSHPLRHLRAVMFNEFARENGVDSELLAFDRSSGLEPLRRCCQGQKTAFFCDSDWFAVDVAEMARSNKILIPSDIGIVALGDMLVGGSYRVCELSTPSFSAIRRPSGDMAALAVRLLTERIAGERSGQGEIVRLPTVFVQRESSLPFPVKDPMGVGASQVSGAEDTSVEELRHKQPTNNPSPL